jgi:hypothetical protein
VGGWLQVWSLLSALVFMNMNWEVERLMRVFFVQNKLMLAANRSSIKLENLHNINLLKASSENAKKLAEAEKKQLRSLVHCDLIYCVFALVRVTYLSDYELKSFFITHLQQLKFIFLPHQLIFSVSLLDGQCRSRLEVFYI